MIKYKYEAIYIKLKSYFMSSIIVFITEQKKT